MHTSVSLFTGAGGLDLGLEQAGFQTVSAVDCDAEAVETLKLNRRDGLSIPGRPGDQYLAHAAIIPMKIEDVDVKDVRPAWAAPGWSPDLLVGGPPCQPFSSSGGMLSVSDPRGRLFEHFVRLAGALRPRFVLFENVRGLVTARGPRNEPGEVLHLVKAGFERAGYATRFALLNAADYGCPQRRVRCFMIGSRREPLPEFPDPTHHSRPEKGLFNDLLPWVSLGEFLARYPTPDANDIVRPTDSLAARLDGLRDGTGLRSAGARESTRPGGHWGYRQGTFIADQSLPARTITASASQDWVRSPDGSLRRLTWRECAGLQGFPAGWQFVGGKASKYRQIGNAVPVQFGLVIGRQLLQAASEKPTLAGANPSAPLPQEFATAIAYTKKEHARNGGSRAKVIALQGTGAVPQLQIKGRGSEDRRPA